MTVYVIKVRPRGATAWFYLANGAVSGMTLAAVPLTTKRERAWVCGPVWAADRVAATIERANPGVSAKVVPMA